MSYLTFNDDLKRDSGISTVQDASAIDGVDLTQELPLLKKWIVWEQVVKKDTSHYKDNTKPIAEFSTVQEFWKLWNSLPQPSELLNEKRMVREADNGVQLVVDAIMIFRENIVPMWESAPNDQGGHFEYKLARETSGAQIDEYWNNLVLSLIGGTLQGSELITGVRLVDKLHSHSQGNIRIEVWFSDYARTDAWNGLKRNIETQMATKLDGTLDTRAIKGESKSHIQSTSYGGRKK